MCRRNCLQLLRCSYVRCSWSLRVKLLDRTRRMKTSSSGLWNWDGHVSRSYRPKVQTSSSSWWCKRAGGCLFLVRSGWSHVVSLCSVFVWHQLCCYSTCTTLFFCLQVHGTFSGTDQISSKLKVMKHPMLMDCQRFIKEHVKRTWTEWLLGAPEPPGGPWKKD